MSHELAISEAEPHHFQQSFEVIQACTKELDKLGLNHWSGYYKDLATYEKMIKEHKSEVFVMNKDGKTVATVAVSPNPPDYYLDPQVGPHVGEGFIKFFTQVEPADSVLYISALGVHPEFQGQGLARSMMTHVEELARQRGIKAIRFDTRAEFAPAVRLYETMGYRKLDFVDEIDETEHYNYFEKIL